jgi:hypothetical protein
MSATERPPAVPGERPPPPVAAASPPPPPPPPFAVCDGERDPERVTVRVGVLESEAPADKVAVAVADAEAEAEVDALAEPEAEAEEEGVGDSVRMRESGQRHMSLSPPPSPMREAFSMFSIHSLRGNGKWRKGGGELIAARAAAGLRNALLPVFGTVAGVQF